MEADLAVRLAPTAFVVASDGELRENNRVVLNSAYQLYLAAKADNGGGGHTHPHPH